MFLSTFFAVLKGEYSLKICPCHIFIYLFLYSFLVCIFLPLPDEFVQMEFTSERNTLKSILPGFD